METGIGFDLDREYYDSRNYLAGSPLYTYIISVKKATAIEIKVNNENDVTYMSYYLQERVIEVVNYVNERLKATNRNDFDRLLNQDLPDE